MDYFFYLVMVNKASADESEESGGGSSGVVPKFYLKPVTVIPLDTFVATHGAFTDVDGELDSYRFHKTIDAFGGMLNFTMDSAVVDPSERILGKRKLVANPVPQLAKPGELNPAKKQKPPAYFVPELAHIVALCDERLPFALITTEVSTTG